jgi:hypothetical protein
MLGDLRAELRIEPRKRALRDQMAAYCTLVNTSSGPLVINVGPQSPRRRRMLLDEARAELGPV